MNARSASPGRRRPRAPPGPRRGPRPVATNSSLLGTIIVPQLLLTSAGDARANTKTPHPQGTRGHLAVPPLLTRHTFDPAHSFPVIRDQASGRLRYPAPCIGGDPPGLVSSAAFVPVPQGSIPAGRSRRVPTIPDSLLLHRPEYSSPSQACCSVAGEYTAGRLAGARRGPRQKHVRRPTQVAFKEPSPRHGVRFIMRD